MKEGVAMHGRVCVLVDWVSQAWMRGFGVELRDYGCDASWLVLAP